MERDSSIKVRYLIALLIAGSVCLPSPHFLLADEALSLTQCIELISENSVQFAQALANEARSRAALDEANKPKLPQLVAQGNIATSSNEVTQATDSNKAVLRIEQGTLPFGSAWKLGTQRGVELDVAHLSKVETKQDVEMLVKQLYFSILRDQDTIENLNVVEETLKHLLSNVAPKFQIGRAPSFDLVKVKTAIYDLTRSREILKSQLIGEENQLAQVIGIRKTSLKLKPVLKLPEIAPTAHTESTPKENPTLLGLSKQVEASEVGVDVAKYSRLPALSAALEYGPTGQTLSTTVPSWTAFAQLRLTVFDWGLISSQVAQARSGVILAEKKLEAESQRIDSDFVQTQSQADAHLMDQSRLQILMPELKKTAIVSIDRYRQGGMSILETTDAVSLWLQNLNNERAAFYAYLSDLAHLERLTGDKLNVKYEN